MEEVIEDLIPVGEYERLIRRIKWSERLNVLLFFSILLVSFLAVLAVGVHTYQYEKKLHLAFSEFKTDVLALTGDQNIAIRNLNRVVADRNWVNFQRVSLEQLKGFCDLRDGDPEKVVVMSLQKDGIGGK
jgi:hypothetical protein